MTKEELITHAEAILNEKGSSLPSKALEELPNSATRQDISAFIYSNAVKDSVSTMIDLLDSLGLLKT